MYLEEENAKLKVKDFCFVFALMLNVTMTLRELINFLLSQFSFWFNMIKPFSEFGETNTVIEVII